MTARKPPLTGLALLAARMPENGGSDSLDYKLRKMLADNFPGLLKQHNSDSRRTHSGWPDWTIGGPRGVIFRELKREGKNPTAEQQAWLDVLAAGGANVGVWRPTQYYDGTIARELAVIADLRVREAS